MPTVHQRTVATQTQEFFQPKAGPIVGAGSIGNSVPASTDIPSPQEERTTTTAASSLPHEPGKLAGASNTRSTRATFNIAATVVLSGRNAKATTDASKTKHKAQQQQVFCNTTPTPQKAWGMLVVFASICIVGLLMATSTSSWTLAKEQNTPFRNRSATTAVAAPGDPLVEGEDQRHPMPRTSASLFPCAVTHIFDAVSTGNSTMCPRVAVPKNKHHFFANILDIGIGEATKKKKKRKKNPTLVPPRTNHRPKRPQSYWSKNMAVQLPILG